MGQDNRSNDLRAKVVVRRLPPNLDEAGFREFIAEWLEKIDYSYYVKGKQSMKELVYSRAYLRFTDPQEVPRFTQHLDGHAFVTERGTQYRCSVEYAPYQKVPKARIKRDPREGTLERDADFQAFLAQLEAGPTPLPSAESQLASREASSSGEAGAGGGSGAVMTALMQFLKDKRSQPPGRASTAAAVGRGRASKAAAAPAATAQDGAQVKKGAKAGKQKAGQPQLQQPQQEQQLQAPKVLQAPDRKQQQQPPASTPAAAAAVPAASRERKKAAAGEKKAAGADQKGAAAEKKGVAGGERSAGSGAGEKQTGKQAPQAPKQLLRKASAAAGASSSTGAEVAPAVQRGGDMGAEAGAAGREAAMGPAPKVLRRPQQAQQAQQQEAAAGAPADGSGAAEEQLTTRQRAARPVRMRAGFGVYQPKRVGRLAEGEEGGT